MYCQRNITCDKNVTRIFFLLIHFVHVDVLITQDIKDLFTLAQSDVESDAIGVVHMCLNNSL